MSIMWDLRIGNPHNVHLYGGQVPLELCSRGRWAMIGRPKTSESSWKTGRMLPARRDASSGRCLLPCRGLSELFVIRWLLGEFFLIMALTISSDAWYFCNSGTVVWTRGQRAHGHHPPSLGGGGTPSFRTVQTLTVSLSGIRHFSLQAFSLRPPRPSPPSVASIRPLSRTKELSFANWR
jgi:hypothetical protein